MCSYLDFFWAQLKKNVKTGFAGQLDVTLEEQL